jgi:hypothetical protein
VQRLTNKANCVECECGFVDLEVFVLLGSDRLNHVLIDGGLSALLIILNLLLLLCFLYVSWNSGMI